MKTERARIIAIISLLAGSILVGFSYVVLKSGLKYAAPLTILIDRLLVAGLVIFFLKKTSVGSFYFPNPLLTCTDFKT